MKRDYILLLIIFIPTLILQLAVVPLISFGAFSPDLLILLLVYFTLLKGQLFGTIAGAIIGLIFDLVSGNVLGITMLSKTIAGFVAGYFYNENKIESNTSSISFAIIVFISAFVDSFFYGLFIDNQSLGFLYIIFEKSLFPAIYNTILALLLIIVLPKRSSL